jgi:hypothetical protein
MQNMRSTLKEHFGRRMRPEVSQLSQGRLRVSIEVERLRLTPHQLELAERHHDVCKIRKGNLILEGEREEIVSCVGALAQQEGADQTPARVAREGRRRGRKLAVVKA